MKSAVVIVMSVLLVAPFHGSTPRSPFSLGDQGACDTITIPGVVDLKYIPLNWYVNGLDLTADERRWVDLGIRSQQLDIDSLWINPEHQAVSMDQLELPVWHISGLRKQITLLKEGRWVTGNWSGKDGSLIINRKTGTSQFHSWF